MAVSSHRAGDIAPSGRQGKLPVSCFAPTNTTEEEETKVNPGSTLLLSAHRAPLNSPMLQAFLLQQRMTVCALSFTSFRLC